MKLKPTDLRIGNWVVNSITGRIVQVYEVLTSRILITTDHPNKVAKHTTSPLSSYSGIPLSPEVLNGLGFEFLNGDVQKWMHSDSLIRLIPSNDKPGQYFLGGFSGSKNICYIKHLHHLQNIMFDLAGFELTYKP